MNSDFCALLNDYSKAQNLLNSESLIHTQGNGGNLSVKSDRFLLVKSSGVSLLDTSPSCFSFIDRSIYKSKSDQKNYLLSGRKESMETPFHSYLDSKYILHLHHLPSLVLSIIGKSNELLKNISSVQDDYNRELFLTTLILVNPCSILFQNILVTLTLLFWNLMGLSSDLIL